MRNIYLSIVKVEIQLFTNINGSKNNIKHTFLYVDFHIVFCMERKLRNINGSLIITLPKQMCDLYNMKAGDSIKIEPIGNNELRLRKVNGL